MTTSNEANSSHACGVKLVLVLGDYREDDEWDDVLETVSIFASTWPSLEKKIEEQASAWQVGNQADGFDVFYYVSETYEDGTWSDQMDSRPQQLVTYDDEVEPC